jgi:tetratricopeptide (TPR) repeat protein
MLTKKYTTFTRRARNKLCALLLVGFVGPVACAHNTPQSADEIGRRLARQGQHAQALHLFTQALCTQDADLTVARDWVRTWDRMGQPEGVVALLDKCGLQPGLRLYIDALQKATLGHSEESIVLFGKAIKASSASDHGDMYLRRARLYVATKRLRLAGIDLQQVALIAPHLPGLYLCQARILLKQNQAHQVAIRLGQMLKYHPSPEHIREGRLLLHDAIGQHEPQITPELMQRIQKAQDVLAHTSLDRHAALSVLDEAHQFPHPKFLLVAGLTALRLGAQNEGERILKMAAKLNPLDPFAARTLGGSYFINENYSQALPWLSQAFALSPLEPSIARELGMSARAQSNHALALKAFSTLTVLEPLRRENHLNLARTQRLLGALQEASTTVERAYQLDTRHIPTLVERAILRTHMVQKLPLRTAQARKAKRWAHRSLEELLDVAPKHPAAKPLLEALRLEHL